MTASKMSMCLFCWDHVEDLKSKWSLPMHFHHNLKLKHDDCFFSFNSQKAKTIAAFFPFSALSSSFIYNNKIKLPDSSPNFPIL